MSVVTNSAGFAGFVYDPQRDLIHIVAPDGTLQDYSVASGSLVGSQALGGSPGSIDITPDGAYLLVGNRTPIQVTGADGKLTTVDDITRVNLATHAVDHLQFSVGAYELGVADLAVAADNMVLVTTAFAGSGWNPFRSFNGEASAPTFATVSGLSEVTGSTSVLVSGNRQHILVQEANISDGPLHLFASGTDNISVSTDLYRLGTSGFNNGLGDVSEARGLVADVTYNNIFVLDTKLAPVADLSQYANHGGVIGAAFDGDGSHLFLWEGVAKTVLILDTHTWKQVGSLAVQSAVGNGYVGDPAGPMDVISGGKLLALNTGGSVELIDLTQQMKLHLAGDNSGQTLIGGVGADTLTGSFGADTLTGGAGADVFAFAVTPWNAGRITDFVVGTDKLDLSALFSASHYIGTDPVADGYLALRSDGAGGTLVIYDTDGPAAGNPWPFTIVDLAGVAPAGLTWSTLSGGVSPVVAPPVTTPPDPPPVTPPSTGGGLLLMADDSNATLQGGAGADTLVAGHGADALSGGGGADVFKFAVTPWNAGKILDFVVGTDRLDLSGLFQASGYSGTDPVGDGYLFLGSDGAGGTLVSYDTDGPASGNPWHFILTDLVGLPTGPLTWNLLSGSQNLPVLTPPPVTTPPASPPSGSGGVVLQGGSGPDLVGGSGSDTLIAGHHDAHMTGGAGADVFVFPVTPWVNGSIMDFVVGTDRLDFSQLFTTYGYAGVDPVADGYVSFVSDNNGGTWVKFDTDGPAPGNPWPFTITDLVGVPPTGLTWAAVSGGASTVTPPGTTPPVSQPPAGSAGVIMTSSSNFPGSALTGAGGDDTLNAGEGSDTLTGGAGSDHFVFANAPWSPAEIKDFVHGQDVLDLRGIFAATGYSGSNPVADHYLSFVSDGAGGTKVLFDADGSGAGHPYPSYIITLDHVDPTTLTSADWVIH